MRHRWHLILSRCSGSGRFKIKRWPFMPPGLAEALVAWGRENARFFPWRAVREPFALLVGEMLLRKTTARQVSKVYCPLMAHYETPEKLANARPEDLQAILRPLGLANQRSAALQSVAGYLLTFHQGSVPSDPEELTKIPHVGPYAANAVGCFGFGLPLPVVDTNVIRVLDRFTGTKTLGANPHRARSIWRRSTRSLPMVSVRDYNYALLDLAALVCKTKPSCSKCCLRSGCAEAKKRSESPLQLTQSSALSSQS